MQVGDKIPAYIQLFDYNATKYPKAVVRDATNTPIAGSPVYPASIANGLYGDGTLAAPITKFVTVQYLVYDDSGHTQLSTSEGGTLDLFFVGGGLQAGDNIPVYLQLFNYATNKYVRATVRDASGSVVGAPVNLTHIANGLYGDISLTMPNTKFVTIQFVVYDDAGYTQISSSQGGASQTIELGSSSTGIPTYFPILAYLAGNLDDCECNGAIEDRIVVGASHTLAIRLMVDKTYLPMDLSSFTVAEVRLMNADGTVLSLKSTDSGTPVTIVAPATLGKISCVITNAQSALLLAQTPAPVTIVLTDGSGNSTMVNLPYQLAVVEKGV